VTGEKMAHLWGGRVVVQKRCNDADKLLATGPTGPQVLL